MVWPFPGRAGATRPARGHPPRGGSDGTKIASLPETWLCSAVAEMREEMAGLPGSTQPYHEMLGPGGVLAKYEGIQRWLAETPVSALATKMQEAELLFR